MKALLTLTLILLLLLLANIAFGQWVYDEGRVVSEEGTTVLTGPITLDQEWDGDLVLTAGKGETVFIPVQTRILGEEKSWFDLGENQYFIVTDDRAMCPKYEGHVIILYKQGFGPQNHN